MEKIQTQALPRGPPPLRLQTPTTPTSNRVAHTLTACTRCRQRKTRCDPGLPRCTPCEKSGAICEYWDSARRQNLNRAYVVWLESRVYDLELEMAKSNLIDVSPLGSDNKEDGSDVDESENMVRDPANVKLLDADETKYLGPSSGTQLTRIVMKLAKTFTSSSSIREIIPLDRAQQIRKLYEDEAVKPTSKVYPLVSDVAATELPERSLTDLLIQLYNLKVQSMYPALHEPTFNNDVEAVYRGHGSDYQHFILRLVIAISLQKMDCQYAGLADSYYLAALKYMDAVVAPMNLQTLQAFALIAEYSLLTPTRTAIYFVIGIAVRLSQALGIHQERTIAISKHGRKLDALEVDMRRRLYWCIFVMEAGLSHALGRPDGMAVDRKNLDVAFFETCADEHITVQGIMPGAPRTIKKWIAIHFFKMRLLQLEIREMLYLNKREKPSSDQDPWFVEMLAKMQAWRDTIPDNDMGISLDKIWFTGRYNTMIALLYRPSPQIPNPSSEAALHCFDAARFNIYITREQLRRGNVDLTWIFTQAIFMAMNTMLWSLSYSEVRNKNPRAEVEAHLEKGMESIHLSASRWPGVSSAHQLYTHITQAVLRIYDTSGDFDLQATPSEVSSPHPFGSDVTGQSPNASPGPNSPLSAPFPMQESLVNGGSMSSRYRHGGHPSPTGTGSLSREHPQLSPSTNVNRPTQSSYSNTSTLVSDSSYRTDSIPSIQHQHQQQQHQSVSRAPYINEVLPHFQAPMMTASRIQQRNVKTNAAFDPAYMLSPIPSSIPGEYYQTQNHTHHQQLPSLAPDGQIYASEYVDPQYWSQIVNETHGLNALQQAELMQSLQNSGVNDIESMIAAGRMLFQPKKPAAA